MPNTDNPKPEREENWESRLLYEAELRRGATQLGRDLTACLSELSAARQRVDFLQTLLLCHIEACQCDPQIGDYTHRMRTRITELEAQLKKGKEGDELCPVNENQSAPVKSSKSEPDQSDIGTRSPKDAKSTVASNAAPVVPSHEEAADKPHRGSRCGLCYWALYDGDWCQNPACLLYGKSVNEHRVYLTNKEAALLIDGLNTISQLETRITNMQRRWEALPGDWFDDSSLKTWFPLTAEKMDSLRLKLSTLETRNEELTLQNETFRNAIKSCEVCDGPTMFEVSALRSELAAERAKNAEQLKLMQDMERFIAGCDDLNCPDRSCMATHALRAHLNQYTK